MAVVRGVWLSHIDCPAYTSAAALAEALRFIAAAGFTHVVPVVWNGGGTFFPSAAMVERFGPAFRIAPPYRGRDPLAEIVEAAGPLGLEVIPWFEYGFASSYRSGGGSLLEARPGWAARDRRGALLSKNGFEWMNAFDADVQDFLLALILEVVERYPVAGIQGDDRLPALPSEGGYDAATCAAYQAETGRRVPRRHRDPAWLRWRADRLTAFLARLHRSVKAIRSDCLVSMAPGPYPFAFREYLQDWPHWLERGLVDLLHPQLYRENDARAYERLLVENHARALVSGGGEPGCVFAPGILLMCGGYLAGPDLLRQCLRINRARGIEGEVLFHYQGLRERDGACAACHASLDVP